MHFSFSSECLLANLFDGKGQVLCIQPIRGRCKGSVHRYWLGIVLSVFFPLLDTCSLPTHLQERAHTFTYTHSHTRTIYVTYLYSDMLILRFAPETLPIKGTGPQDCFPIKARGPSKTLPCESTPPLPLY